MNARAIQEHAVDPRVERSRRIIREAALAELAAAGYGAFSIETVAARAGVGKSTVYRHWDSKVALIADALETLNEQPGPRAVEGTAREQVERLLRHLAEVLTDSTVGACLPVLIDAAERDEGSATSTTPTPPGGARRWPTSSRTGSPPASSPVAWTPIWPPAPWRARCATGGS